MREPLPSPMDLLMQTFDAVKENPAGFFLAGLGPFVVMFPLTFGLVFVAYAAMAVGMVPGLMMEDELVSVLGAVGLFSVVLLAAIVGLMAIVGPLYASLMRAIHAAQVGGEPLSIGAPFATLRQDLGKILGIYLLSGLGGMIGALMCYVPGLLVGFLLEFALPAVAIDRMSPTDAARRSVSHVRENPGWAAGVFAITMGIIVILSQVPLVGAMIAVPMGFDFQIRAYRAAFGGAALPDGDAAVGGSADNASVNAETA